jgi:cytochrome c-type biogenesis protein CcmH/NrfG
MYRASEKILADVLSERPDYIEVKKMLGFSLFELGKYDGAKKYLLEYLERNPKDIESIIRMGEISAKL